MPDKKLTDSEIVKALEYWREFDKEIDQMLNGRFKGDKMLLEQKEIVKITLNLFDLINRLQSEKQNLEIELKAMRGAANSYKAENERLNNAIDEQDIEIAQLYKRLDKAKTESYTDFAESLKKDFDNPHIQKFGLDFVKFLRGVVDNRLKELVGDNNA